jgi:hypothetical protein
LVGGWNAFAPTNVGSILVPAVVKIIEIMAIAFVPDEAIVYTTRLKLRHGVRRG